MRSINVFRNVTTGVAKQLFIELLRFAVRTVFIYTLSKAYLGISGLFSNILNILSITELGFGAAIVFALYKPLADKDVEKIKSLMALYKKAYRLIGLSVLLLGFILTPFLPYILKETTELVNIYFIFILYLLQSASSYFFFAYKAALISADQKGFIVNAYQTVLHLGIALVNIATLLLLRNVPTISFYIYTATGIAGNVVINILIAKKADAMYPFLTEKNILPLDPELKRGIKKNVAALSVSRVSRAALTSVDSIVISMTMVNGVSAVGVYSNYLVIVNAVEAFFSTLSASLTSSLGNLFVTEEPERNKEVFNGLHLFYAWAYGFCAICLWNLINPFIGGIWINKSWLLSDTAVFLIGINFLLNGLMAAPIKYIQAAGLYWQARYRYIISAVLNIGLSVLFVVVFHWGIEGVLFATTFCLVGMLCFDPYIVFKNVFRESSAGFYFKYCLSLGIILATNHLVGLLCSLLPEYSIRNFVLRMLFCIVVPNALWLLLFHRLKEYRMLKSMATALFARLGIGSRKKNKEG